MLVILHDYRDQVGLGYDSRFSAFNAFIARLTIA